MSAVFSAVTSASVASVSTLPPKLRRSFEVDWPTLETVEGSLSEFSGDDFQGCATGGYAKNIIDTLPRSVGSKVLGQALAATLVSVIGAHAGPLSLSDLSTTKPGAVTFYRRDNSEASSDFQLGVGSWFKILSSLPASPVIVYQVEKDDRKMRSATADFLGPDVVRQARTVLAQLQLYENGWNGVRSLGADLQSFAKAQNFLQLISRSSALVSVEPTIFSLGTAVLEVETESAKLLLEFLADGTLLANVDTADNEYDYDIADFSGAGLPIQIARYF